MSEFSWPWQYDFPPFFTIQVNDSTRRQQLAAWSSLVLDYCQRHKIFTIDVLEAQQSPLFHNDSIHRQLSVEAVRTVLDHLREKGNAEWLDKQKCRCQIHWRRPEEWASLIYNWVVENSFRNSVCTFYELTEGDDTEGEPFHRLEREVLLRALKILQSEGKAEILAAEEGVKFF